MRKNPLSAVIFVFLLSLASAVVSAAEGLGAENGQSSTVLASGAQIRVDLNTADAETLERELLGIGAVRAKSIVDYREANGPFASVEELLEVKGIGHATLEKNRNRLTIN